VPKCVMSSSPSTRFDGSNIVGLTEDQLPPLPQKEYLAEYAETKALGELAMRDACSDEFLTVAVAPHQVYGPRDTLFLPNILEAAGAGRLRVFGNAKNHLCLTHVDNYCHALIIAEEALYPKSPALGKFYIVTDAETHPNPDGSANMWDLFEEAVVGMGFPSIKAKWSVPTWLIMAIAYLCSFVSILTGVRFKLNPFAVRMMTMDRWFNTSAAAKDLKYRPILDFKKEWPNTIKWFRENWLPKFKQSQKQNRSWFGLYKPTQDKIDVQAGNATKKGQ